MKKKLSYKELESNTDIWRILSLLFIFAFLLSTIIWALACSNLEKENTQLKEQLNGTIINEEIKEIEPNIFGNYVLKYRCYYEIYNDELTIRKTFKSYDFYNKSLKNIKEKGCEVLK